MAHDMAMQRVIQAGGVPVTWLQVLLEFQRDWARRDTYDAVMDIVRQHAGGYGVGVEYATPWCMARRSRGIRNTWCRLRPRLTRKALG